MSSCTKLTDGNFLIYAMKNYDNPHCLDMKEFHNDLKRVKYIKRLINRYKTNRDLKERLIINHIIILSNLFGVEASVKILLFKLDEELWPQLFTFLIFLNYLPNKISGIQDQDIVTSEIPLDAHIIQKLREM